MQKLSTLRTINQCYDLRTHKKAKLQNTLFPPLAAQADFETAHLWPLLRLLKLKPPVTRLCRKRKSEGQTRGNQLNCTNISIEKATVKGKLRLTPLLQIPCFPCPLCRQSWRTCIPKRQPQKWKRVAERSDPGPSLGIHSLGRAT